ncbi:variable surface protein Vir12 [Plasmodium vivax Mauritania I]|uniref:Variable surface protein Vir12 n=1 Tax=Plasmodium vivax Mauritania I TaxID=1035515 RepID=A0A0J9THI8_PLAVI|nr:variable surface protein Vir12 [Plasmodium vivax Mauritania I]
MFLIFQEAILKELPAYETYENFEKNTDSSDYISKCNSLGSIGNETKNLCEKYARNLQSICKTGNTTITSTTSTPTTSAPSSRASTATTSAPSSSTAASTTDGTTAPTPTVSTSVAVTSGITTTTTAAITTTTTATSTKTSINVPEAKVNCLLLKYWLFNKIKKLSDNELKGKNLDTLIQTIHNLQFEIYKKQDNRFFCFNDIYEYLDNWEEEKYLYEYFKNVPKIESFNKTNETDCEAYKKYINHVKTYYDKKKEKELCCTNNYFKCSDYFNCDPKYHPDKILNKINVTDTAAKGASVSGLTSDSISTEETPKTRIENHRCIVRRDPNDPHLAYLSCFNVPTVYKDVDDYFPKTDIPKKETGKNSEGEVELSSKGEVGEQSISELSGEEESATNAESPSGRSQTSKKQKKTDERITSDSSPKVNILDKVKSLLGLGKYIRNIIDSEYPLFIRETKTTIENGSSHTYITPSWKKVQIEDTEKYFNLLESSDNFINTKSFKSIMTGILTFGVIFVFFLYYKVSKSLILKYKCCI